MGREVDWTTLSKPAFFGGVLRCDEGEELVGLSMWRFGERETKIFEKWGERNRTISKSTLLK